MTPLSAGSYFGRVVRRREAGGFTITEAAYPPGMTIPRHAHQNAYLCAVLQGSYTEWCRSREQVYEAAALVLHPQGQTHADRFHCEGGRCLNIELTPARLANLEEHPLLEGCHGDLSGGSVRCLVDRLHREFTAADAPSALALEGLVLELLAETARRSASAQERHPPSWLAQVRDLLHEEFTRPLTLEEIALVAGVHPTHLARTFRCCFHCTIGEYVRRLRIEQACRELASSELSLAEIALECGFYDHSQFTRTFRVCTGLTPSAYRRNCRR